MRAENERLREANADLLAALKAILANKTPSAVTEANRAVAKAEGGTG